LARHSRNLALKARRERQEFACDNVIFARDNSPVADEAFTLDQDPLPAPYAGGFYA